jgi:uncharacterized protein YkwD
MLLGRSLPALVTLGALAASGAGGSAGAAPAAPCPHATTPGILIDAPTYEKAVVCLVNRERAAANRRPLKINPRLRRAATRYAAKLVAEGFFDHVTPSGNSSILSRLQAVGYLEDATEWGVGENLIYASGPNAPATIVEGWVESPGHRENMLRPAFREIGVGVAGGTPVSPTDPNGLTVASEYGFRTDQRPERRKPKR